MSNHLFHWFYGFKLYWAITYLTAYVSIFDFASLVGIPIGIGSSSVGFKVCVIIVTAGIKKYKFIIMKKRRSMIK